MPYLGSWDIDDYLTFAANTHDNKGASRDADSAPLYRVYEDETATPILTGNLAILDDANTTGFYTEQIQLTAANGFEVGKSYTIYIEAEVKSIKGTISHTLQIQAKVNAVNAITVTTNNDKTGYSLADPQNFDLIGNITGSVSSVVDPVTVGTNNDKTGYALSAAGVDALWDELQAGHVTTGSFGWYLDQRVSLAGSFDPDVNYVMLSTGSVYSIWEELQTRYAGITGSFGYYLDSQVSEAGGGTGTADWTSLEKSHIRNRIGIDGASALPSATPTLAIEANVEGHVTNSLNTYDPPTKAELDTTESNIRGSDSDDLKTLSDQLDTAQADLDSPNQYKADVTNLDQAISTTESNIRGTDSDDLKTLSDQLDTAQTDLDNPNQYKATVAGLSTFDNTSDQVIVATNNDKTGYALTTANITSIAESILKLDWTTVAGEASRSVLNALRFLRIKWSVAGTTLTVTEEDDVTSAWTATVTSDATADPITGSDPV